jgi:hypothetical protein
VSTFSRAGEKARFQSLGMRPYGRWLSGPSIRRSGSLSSPYVTRSSPLAWMGFEQRLHNSKVDRDRRANYAGNRIGKS